MKRQKAAWVVSIFVTLVACNFFAVSEETVEDRPSQQQEIGTHQNILEEDRHGKILTLEDLCPDLVFKPITNLEVLQTPDMDEPAARLPYREPVFGTCVVRVTDRHKDVAPGDISAGLKNEYSRVQSFNADGRYFLIRGVDATWYVYSASTLEPLLKLPFEGAVDPRWSATNPNQLSYSDETRLVTFDLLSGQQSVVHEFADDFPNSKLASVSTRYEGSQSMDGRFWGFMAQNQDWETIAFLVYDQLLDKVVATRELNGAPEVDSVTISPLSNYFLAYFDYCEIELGQMNQPCGLMVYDRSLQNGRGLLRIAGHSDIALDTNGKEVLIYQDIDTDTISLLDLESGRVTTLSPIDFSHSALGFHFSGRSFNQRGWALVSTYNGGYPEDATWMDDQIFVIELKENGRLIRLAHTHSLVDEDQEHDYWAEPQATTDRNMSRVLFTSNWGRSGNEEVETFMILLPEGWLNQLPIQ